MGNENRIIFDPFSLDLTNECLWRGSQTIKLRPKAFAVLNYLLGRPGQLVTKENLLNAVWPETFVSDAVLKVAIRQLREALGDRLVRDGHGLRIYVPFGQHWYSYSLRRLQENPKIAGYIAADTLQRLVPRRDGTRV